MTTQTTSTTAHAFVFSGHNFGFWFHTLPRLVMAGLLLLAATAPLARAYDPLADEDEVRSGRLFLRDAAGKMVGAPNLSSKAHLAIAGLVAEVELEQTFRNDGDEWVEGIYAFPLPDDAAVRYLEMRVGERRIVGKIREREHAKQIYQAARAAGKKASLVEQQRPNFFTNRIANLGPGESITVTLRYVQPVTYEGGEFSLRLPTTITPRYIPGVHRASEEIAEEQPALSLAADPYLGWALPTDRVPDANAITPFLNPQVGSDTSPINAITITADLNPGMPLAEVGAAYHELAITREQGRYRVALASRRSEMDRDFVLRWRAVASQEPQAAYFAQQWEGEHYGLLMLMPPAVEGTQAAARLPRETVFVVDTSGSMGGVSIVQARQALTTALLTLQPEDAFNIIAFSDGTRALSSQSLPASRHNVQRGQEFVRLLQAGGGTRMLPALQRALGSDAEQGERLRQVVFITDGAVGNETELFTEISNTLGSNRLYTVGIGSAPNSWFMRKAASFGRGTFTHIGDISEAESRMVALFEQIAAPVAAGIRVQWPVGVQAESYPAQIPDLYAGQPVMLSTAFGAQAPAGQVAVSGRIAGSDWSRTLELNSGADHAGIASVWARRKIESLLDEKVTGRAEVLVRADVLPLALSHSLLSPYTSFVAVEERISRPAEADLQRKPVTNVRPKGQSPQPYAYPRTATGSPGQLLLGALLLFVAMMVYVMRREEVDHAPLAV